MRPFFIVLALLTAFSAALAAQESQPGHVWLSLGFGYGRLRLGCDSCSRAGGAAGPVYLLGFGLILSPSWRAGLELDATTRGTVGDRVASLTAMATYAPFRHEGLFFKAGVGGARFDSQAPDGPNEQGDGWSVIAGAGYALRVSGSLGMTPILTVRYSDLGEIRFHHLVTGTGVREMSCAFSVGITFY